MGITTSLLLLVSSGLISRSGQPKSIYPLLAISPALFFVSIMSAWGYFQRIRYASTALSQIVEQLGKLIMGLTLAAMASQGPGLPLPGHSRVA